MAMIARSPVWGSWQNTTCSCPSRAAGTWAVASWGYADAVPPGLLAKTFVTVVTLLASSRVLVDADLASSVCPPLGATVDENGRGGRLSGFSRAGRGGAQMRRSRAR